MNTTFQGTIHTTCPCTATHISASTREAQRWLRTHTCTYQKAAPLSLITDTPIVIPVPVKGARFARITPTPNGSYVLRLVDGTADIAYRDRSPFLLRQFAERWFNTVLRWQATDTDVMWVAP